MVAKKKPKKPTLISVRDQIYEGIKEMILTNSYEPGQILQIDRLADEFGVSSTPIREALIRLESFGLVTLIPNKGARVAEISEQDVEHTWEMRLVLEPHAARISAGLSLDTELVPIHRTVSWILDGNYDLDTYIDSDLKLHEQLYIHLPNPVLRETVQRVHQLSMRMRYFPEGFSQMQETVIHRVSEEHLAILNALMAHDPEGAAEAVRIHLTHGKERAVECLREVELSGVRSSN
jgi:DNA-binding GntR family transcriptional regulator